MLFKNESIDVKIEILRKNMLMSYKSICRGIAIIAFLFPALIYIYGKAFSIDLQPTISHYYFAPGVSNPEKEKPPLPPTMVKDPLDHPVRTLFVGGLFAIGTFLILFKGFSQTENFVLNSAGLLAIGVAFFPMERWTFLTHFSPHGVCAVSMFICMMYIAILGNRASLELHSHLDEQRRYSAKYIRLAWLMGLFAPIGWIANVAFGDFVISCKDSDSLVCKGDTVIFFVEAAGVVIFAYFWWVKSVELHDLANDPKIVPLQLAASPVK